MPTVSVPVSWEEVEQAAVEGDPRPLTFRLADVPARAEQGDLLTPVLRAGPALPA